MTKTEEALCNGILFSVPRLVPTAVQEGELDNALYYVIVYLTPQLDKALMKFYEAPSYTPLKLNNKEINCIECDLVKHTDSNNEDAQAGYDFGCSRDGYSKVLPDNWWLNTNPGKVYNGLMLYPGLKCLIINALKEIILNNNPESK